MAKSSKSCTSKMNSMLAGKGKGNKTIMAGKPIKKAGRSK